MGTQGLRISDELFTSEALRARFWSKVTKTESCWIWTGAVKDGWYGTLWMPGAAKYEYAHRLSYALHLGPIPAGLFVCHRCDNPICVSPGDFFLGTQADNAADMRAKGRGVDPPTIYGEAHHAATLSDGQIRELRSLRGFRQRDIAQMFGVSQSTVWRILHGITRATA